MPRRVASRSALVGRPANHSIGPWMYVIVLHRVAVLLHASFRPRLAARPLRFANHRTAVYGPVRTVVWEGWSCEASPYPDWLA
jgi:hypothetical protein